MRGSFRKYLITVLFARHSEQSIGVRSSRELRTLALVLDLLQEGNLAGVGDVLVQRWKAVETSIVEGGWTLARHQELIPAQEVGLSSEAERRVVARCELDRVKLDEVSRRASGRERAPPTGGGGARSSQPG